MCQMKEYHCCVCHIKHSVPATMEKWTCPNGHSLIINRTPDPTEERIKELTKHRDLWKGWYNEMKKKYESEYEKNKKLRARIKKITN